MTAGAGGGQIHEGPLAQDVVAVPGNDDSPRTWGE